MADDVEVLVTNLLNRLQRKGDPSFERVRIGEKILRKIK